ARRPGPGLLGDRQGLRRRPGRRAPARRRHRRGAGRSRRRDSRLRPQAGWQCLAGAGGGRTRPGNPGGAAAAAGAGAGRCGGGHLGRPLAPLRARRPALFPHFRSAHGDARAPGRGRGNRGRRRRHACRCMGYRADGDGRRRGPALRRGPRAGCTLRRPWHGWCGRSDDPGVPAPPGRMSPAPGSSRGALPGQLVLFALLLAAAGLLRARLGGDWWPAPPPAGRGWLAALLGAAWLALTLACLRSGRSGQASVADTGDAVLVAWASQTGFAASLAERSAAMLRAGGRDVVLLPLDQVDPARLAATRQALFVASTTGEGDPPDHALRFLRQMEAGGDLSHLQYALLALGDRSY